MLKALIREGAKAKILKNKVKIRAKIQSIPRQDLNTIIEAIQQERDIINHLPLTWLDELKKQTTYFGSLADAEFLLGLTCEILPEYASVLRGKEQWLEGQIAILKDKLAR